MKREWGLGLLGALGLGFIAVRVNGKLRPKPMPVQIELV